MGSTSKSHQLAKKRSVFNKTNFINQQTNLLEKSYIQDKTLEKTESEQHQSYIKIDPNLQVSIKSQLATRKPEVNENKQTEPPVVFEKPAKSIKTEKKHHKTLTQVYEPKKVKRYNDRQNISQIIPLDDGEVQFSFYETMQQNKTFFMKQKPREIGQQLNPKEFKSQRSNFDEKLQRYMMDRNINPYLDNNAKPIESSSRFRQNSSIESIKLPDFSSVTQIQKCDGNQVLRKANQQMLSKKLSQGPLMKTDVQILKNIDSIQNMHKGNSQTTVRRSLYSQNADESNDVFLSHLSLLSQSKANRLNRSAQPIETINKMEVHSDPYSFQNNNDHYRSQIRKNLIFMQEKLQNNKKQIIIQKNQQQLKVNYLQKNFENAFEGSKQFSKSQIMDMNKVKKEIFREIEAKKNGIIIKNIDDQAAMLEVPKSLKIDANLFNSHELKHYWGKELDQQIRGADFVDFDKYFHEQEYKKELQEKKNRMNQDTKIYGLQSRKSNSLLVKDNEEDRIDQEQLNEFLEKMGEDERAVYEQETRNKVLEAIDEFLSKKNIEEAIEMYKDNLRYEKFVGYSPELRRQILVAKMMHKFNEVSDKLINSYWWESKRQVKVPKNPNMLRQLITSILQITENELIQRFVKKIDKSLTSGYKKFKSCSKNTSSVDESSQAKSMIMNKLGLAIKRLSTSVFKPIDNDQDERMRKSMTKVINKGFMNKFNKFHDQLMDKYYQIEQEISESDFKNREIRDPTIAKDLNAVIEDNLERIMNNSDTYQSVKKASKEKQELQIVQQNAHQMTDFLKGKAAQKKAQFLKDQKRLADANLIHMLFGSSRDALVLKFIQKLKNAVQVRRDIEAKTQKETFIKSVLKKIEFNQEIKQAGDKDQPLSKQLLKERDKIVEEIKDVLQKNNQADQGVEKVGVLMKNKFKQSTEEKQKVILEELQSAMQRKVNQSSLLLKVRKQIGILLQDQKNQQADESDSASSSSSQTQESDEEDQDQDEEQLKKYQSTQEAKIAMSQYIRKSIENGQPPLPILNRVVDGYLSIVNYQINETNAQSLAEACMDLIPKIFKKIYLINNNLKDQSIASIFQSISDSIGLQAIGVIGNGFGQDTYEALEQFTIQGTVFRSLKKFILKDPNPYKAFPYAASRMINSIAENGFKFRNLRKLVLQGIGFDLRCAVNSAKVVNELQNLKQLDISGNGINGNGLKLFLKSIEKTQLMHLNIAYNSCFTKGLAYVEESFEEVLAEYIHGQQELVHLDISGLGMKFAQILYVVRRGIRKSRTLISVHMDGMGLQKQNLIELRDALNVLQVFRNPRQEIDDNFNRILLATTITIKLNEVFFFEEDEQRIDYMKKSNERNIQNLKNQVKQKVNQSSFQVTLSEQIVFQRILGHPELPLGHRWIQKYSHDCCICRKMTYTVFVWNKKLSQMIFNNQAISKIGEIQKQFYKHSNIETIENQYADQQYPLLQVRGQPIQEMIPVVEFLERLDKIGINNVRHCNNQIEAKRFKLIDQIVENNKVVKSQIWQERQNFDMKYETMEFDEIQAWPDKIRKLIPAESFQPINLKQYQKQIEGAYLPKELHQGIQQDTFLCGMYLPSGTIDFVVKHKEFQGVFYMRSVQKSAKHLSINRIPINQKMVKKVKEIKYFSLEQSIFKGFKHVTEEVIDKAFNQDKELMKLVKFIKDNDDLEQTLLILRTNFMPIYNQFLAKIASPKSYPSITLLEFSSACNKWGVFDKYLSHADIDRLFIATNYEEQDLDDNDGNNLCRYEFFEIIVRMAKCKYFDKDRCDTVAESVQRILKEYILQNSIEFMENQQFRDKYLWTLDVDEIIKLNSDGIEKLYKKASSNTVGSKRFFSKDDSINLITKAMLPISDLKNTIAYTLSKQFLENEMGEFDKYNQMLLQEFYEYLGRLAHLLYPENIPLSKKIERILGYFFPLIGLDVQPPVADEDIDSESDYDDDQVDISNQKLLKKLKQQENEQNEENDKEI